MDRKGKQVAGSGSYSGGRKRKGGDDGDTAPSGNEKKRKNPAVLQFFEDASTVGYYGESSDESEFSDADLEEESDEPEPDAKIDPGRGGDLPIVFPKEEEMDNDEFVKMMEERYKSGSVKYADDDVKGPFEMEFLAPTAKDPQIWKVKCMVGRERHSVFCLMHKFVELQSLGTKLQIISAFSVEHVKGFIFIEAEKEGELLEACKGLSGIYSSRMMVVPKNEAPHLLSFRRKTSDVSKEKWAHVKNGKYKGDLAQIVAVNDSRRKALIKLIPRIDLQALAKKYGGGVPIQKGVAPAPRLISSSELEEFRPLIQHRCDRDTGMTFEILDGMMLKDGYLYKKVSIDSLCSWGVMPSKEDILKFTVPENNGSGDLEWLSDLYGEQKKKKKTIQTDKGGEKGEGSSGSSLAVTFDLYTLVSFSRKEFGLIVGMEKDGYYKILKEGSNGPHIVTVGSKELKNGVLDIKFTALDMHNKTISINDLVKVSGGPSQGKQGIVKQVYRGVIFIYDENEEENGGYLCCKSQICEKIKLSTDVSNEKGGGSGAFGFEESVSSPISPLSPEKKWQARDNNNNYKRGDDDNMFSIGQTLRIRVGPLKGYLCRVLAMRRSEITVKLDSQHKILTVKSEHLSEVRSKNSTLPTSEDVGPSSFKQFEMLATEGGSEDWTKGAGISAEGGGWNAGGASAEWSSWNSVPASDIPALQESNPANPFTSEGSKEAKATPWDAKEAPDSNKDSWGSAVTNNKAAGNTDQAGGWNSWGKTTSTEAVSANVASETWGNASLQTEDPTDRSNIGGSSRSKQEEGASWNKKDEGSGWGKSVGSSSLSELDGVSGKGGSSWGKSEGGSSWSKKDGDSSRQDGNPSWTKQDTSSNWNNSKEGNSCWGKKDGGFGESKQDGGGFGESKQDGGSSWCKQDSGSNWAKQGCGWDKQNKDSTCIEKDGGSWGKQDGACNSGTKGGSSVWSKQDEASNSTEKQGGSSWVKQDGGSSWSKRDDGGSGWAKQDGGSSWAKQDGGSSWSKKSDWKDSAGDNSDREQRNWERPESFDRAGRGFGGRRGRRGGRDDFGRGRSFGRGQSFDKSSHNFSASGSSGDGGSSWSNQVGGSSWSKQDGGTSWGKQGGGSTSWGNQDGGFDGSKQHKDSSWNKQEGSSSWNNKQDGGSSWNNKQDGGSGSGKQEGGSSWGKQDNGSSGDKQDSGSSWNKLVGGSSWDKKDGGGGPSWGKQEGGSSGNKQDGVASWGKQDSGGSNSGKQDGGGSSWGKKEDGVSWGKKDGVFSQEDGGSSWAKKDGGGSSWGKKEDGGSSWGNKDGGSSWGNKDGGGSSWGKKDGGSSSWGKKDDGCSSQHGGGSSWGNKDGGGSSWGKGDGGSSWGKEDGNGGEERNWGRSQSFDRGGRGSGGRRGGGGGGFRGGRSQFGRGGRSFDRDQSGSGWKKETQESNWQSDGGNSSSWKSDQGGGGGWGKPKASEGEGGSKWKQGWGQDNNKDKPSESSGGGNWSSWGASTGKNEAKEGNDTNAAADGWKKSKDDAGTSGASGQADAWAKSASGSWGGGNDGGKKGGW